MPHLFARSLSAAGSARWRLTAPSRESDVAESRAGAVRQEEEEMKGRGGGGREGSRGEERMEEERLFSFFFYSPGASDQQRRCSGYFLPAGRQKGDWICCDCVLLDSNLHFDLQRADRNKRVRKNIWGDVWK